MIDETNLLNFYCTGIYDTTKALSETEITMKVLEKLNMVILNFNELETQTLKNLEELNKQVNYYINDGIRLEVTKQLKEMIENGTISSIICEELTKILNNNNLGGE